MILQGHPELQRLSPSDKLQLVSELWDDLATHPESVPVTRDQLAEMDRRMEGYLRAPTEVTSWEVVKERLLKRNQ